MDRRSFLNRIADSSCQAAALMLLGGCKTVAVPPASEARKGRVLLSLAASVPGTSTLRIYDWDAGKSQDFTIPLANPHSLVLDRKNHDLAYFFESFGSAVKFNTMTGEAVRVDHMGTDSMFCGHGVPGASGDSVFSTEIVRNRGALTSLRSAKDMKFQKYLPKECGRSHQIIHLPGGTVLACGNMNVEGKFRIVDGQRIPHGAITFYDYAKEQVLNRVEFDVPILHLTALSPTSVLAVSSPRKGEPPLGGLFGKSSLSTTSTYFGKTTFFPGPIYSASVDGSSKKFWLENEPDLFRYSFAVAPLPGAGTFLSTQHVANQVLLWKDSQVVHRFDVPSPSHLLVSKDGKEFIVRYQESRLKAYSLETLAEVGNIGNPQENVLTLASY